MMTGKPNKGRETQGRGRQTVTPCKCFVRHDLILRCDNLKNMTFSFPPLVLNTSYFSALDCFSSSYDVAYHFKGIGLKISMTHPIKKLLAFCSDSVRQETNSTEKPYFSPSFSTVLWSRCEPPPESALIMVARVYGRNACRCTASKGGEK